MSTSDLSSASLKWTHDIVVAMAGDWVGEPYASACVGCYMVTSYNYKVTPTGNASPSFEQMYPLDGLIGCWRVWYCLRSLGWGSHCHVFVRMQRSSGHRCKDSATYLLLPFSHMDPELIPYDGAKATARDSSWHHSGPESDLA